MTYKDCLVLVFLALMIIMLAILIYAVNEIKADEKLCHQLGGLYVKVYSGFECIKDNKVINLDAKRNNL